MFEYNGVDAPVYNTANAVSNSTVMPVALPLTWLYFTATEDNNDIHLRWGIADEINTRHFVIERSAGNANFVTIGDVQAIGSGSHDYSFTDHTKPAGTVSYRIRQVDMDDHFTYSKQVIVRAIVQQAAMKLYPNPATGFTRISLPQGLQQAAVNIYSMDGKLVITKTVN
ncbi:MAG: T9SS type A sorting domain-containing protein [Bacteroidota bacterium]